ncbi:hypothetical protein ACTFIT_008083 [Dictyostelium discoideum]
MRRLASAFYDPQHIPILKLDTHGFVCPQVMIKFNSKLVSGLMVCYMRFPCNNERSDSRPSFSEVAMLTMFATIKNSDLGFKQTDIIVFDDNGEPFDILRTFYGVNINNPFANGTAKFGFDHLVDATLKPLAPPSIDVTNDTKSIFPLSILYEGGKLLDGDYSNFGKEESTNGVCNPCNRKRKKWSSRKSLVETEKPSKPSKVGLFTRFGRWVKGLFVTEKKSNSLPGKFKDSDIEMVELQPGEEQISEAAGVEHSQIRYRGTNYFFELGEAAEEAAMIISKVV